MKSFLKIAGLSAVVALMFACTKSEGPVSALGDGLYAVESISLTARSGHEQELEAFISSMNTALDVRFEKDSAAIAVIDSIVELNNYKYISGVFHLQKGSKEGVRDNLKRYEMRETGYAVLSTVQCRMNSVDGTNPILDSMVFIRALDSLQVTVAATEDENKMKSEISAFQSKWNRKGKIAAFLALCHDYDTVGTYSIGYGKNVMQDTVMGYSSFVWSTPTDSAKVWELYKRMLVTLDTINARGLTQYEAGREIENLASQYNNLGIAGRLYVVRRWSTAYAGETIWPDWEQVVYYWGGAYKTIDVTQSGLVAEVYGVTINQKLTESSYLTEADFMDTLPNPFSKTGEPYESHENSWATLMNRADEFYVDYEKFSLYAISWRQGYSYPAYQKQTISYDGILYRLRDWNIYSSVMGTLYSGGAYYKVSGYDEQAGLGKWQVKEVTLPVYPVVVFVDGFKPENIKYDGSSDNDMAKLFVRALKYYMAGYLYVTSYYFPCDYQFDSAFQKAVNDAIDYCGTYFSYRLGKTFDSAKLSGQIKGQRLKTTADYWFRLYPDKNKAEDKYDENIVIVSFPLVP